MWDKFKDYVGPTHTDMSLDMILLTYGISLILSCLGLIIRVYWNLTPTSRRINLTAVTMLVLGLVWLSALLASPYAVVVRR